MNYAVYFFLIGTPLAVMASGWLVSRAILRKQWFSAEAETRYALQEQSPTESPSVRQKMAWAQPEAQDMVVLPETGTHNITAESGTASAPGGADKLKRLRGK